MPNIHFLKTSDKTYPEVSADNPFPTTSIGTAQSDGSTTTAVPNAGFNGTTWDRWRNNTEGTLLASAARTAATTSANITNYNAQAITVYLDVTVASGLGGLIVKIQGIDPVSGKIFRLNADIAVITTTGVRAYTLGLGASGAGGGTSQDVVQGTAVALPRSFNVLVYHSDASSYTYSLGYALSV